ncbi:tetratricopeptide repeat protein [Litoribacillus peritrichatus]|uniref:Tetratricopeptide repeat protein n=1 Tax=Litoribacillus peritrichatus TaxID=718191 RepID=A0ABP7MAT2_9GAMM
MIPFSKKIATFGVGLILSSSFAFAESAADSSAVSSSSKLTPAELDKYGFEKVDKTVRQERLIKRFNNDKNRLEMAIDNTKALILQSHGKPYMPELYLRLAELYIEKSRVAYFLRRTESGAAITSSLDSLETNALKLKAIEVYQRILNNYPKFKYRGKVHFYLAHEFRELNRLEEMVKHYQAIIKNYPQSEYVPESYLLLGDYFFDNKNLKDAESHYQQVLNFPNSSAITIARYKLAWVHINNKDWSGAIALLEQSIEKVDEDKEFSVDTYSRVDVRLEALNDIAFVFTDHYKKLSPEETLQYFREYAWSRPVYLGVLEKLAYRFFIKKKWAHASMIYRELAAIQHEPAKQLEYIESLYTTTRHLKDYSNANIDVKDIATALNRVRYSTHYPEEGKARYFQTFEIYARDLATQLHDLTKQAKSQKAGLVQTKSDKTSSNKAQSEQANLEESSLIEDFSKAADAYESYLDVFEESAEYDKMSVNYAEALFLAKRFVEAGDQYETLALKDGEASDAESINEKYLYSATLSYYQSLKENRDSLNYYEVVQSQTGLARTGTLYATTYPNSKNTPNVLFNVAWIKYDEGKYEEAIEQFTAFAEAYPSGKEAEAAIRLSLDAFHALEDYEGLIDYGKQVAQIVGLSSEILSETAQVASAAEAKVISNLTVASMEDWESGKNDMLEYAQAHESTGLGEAALKALFISSKEKNDIETMQIAGKNYINKYPKSAESKNILNVMIEASIRTQQYRVLVDNLEDFAQSYPTDPNASDFLYQAATLREGMNQLGLARTNYNTLLSKYEITQTMRKNIVLSMVESDLKNGQLASAIKLMETNLRGISQDDKALFNARIASLYHQQNNPQRAASYQKVAAASFNGAADHQQKAAMSEMVYLSTANYQNTYNGLKLQGIIDEQIFANKTELYDHLSQTLYSVLEYQSPKWSILACFRLYEVNMEYANFLNNAPLPDMSPEEQAEYKGLIAAQAQEYIDEAQQYLETGNGLAERLNSFDPLLTTYEKSAGQQQVSSFMPVRPSIQIGVDAFQDEALREIHNLVSRDPKDISYQLKLAKTYLMKEDIGLARTIASNIVSASPGLEKEQATEAQMLLGMTSLLSGDDKQARSALEKAIELDQNNFEAAANLAALYQHYGLSELASGLYQTIPNDWEITHDVNEKAKTNLTQYRAKQDQMNQG